MSAIRPPAGTEATTHRLNPNCCYQACAGCASVRRLTEFQSQYPSDWPARLAGSPRLLAVARGEDASPAPGTGGRCEECGAFDAVEFGGTWICAGCCSQRGSCCCESTT